MAASVTRGRALRYAEGSARGLLHHHPGHYLGFFQMCPNRSFRVCNRRENSRRNLTCLLNSWAELAVSGPVEIG